MVQAADLHLANLGSNPTGTYKSLVGAGRVAGQKFSGAPVKVLPNLVGTSKSLNKEVNGVKFGRTLDVSVELAVGLVTAFVASQ